jgi:hypothetical protein
MQAKLAQAPSEHCNIERKVSAAGDDAAEPNGLGQKIGRGNAAGERTY